MAAQQQASRKVTRMCITIAATFTVSWLPYQLARIVMVYGDASRGILILPAAKTLAYFNSCVNPIVYGLMWRPFRISLIQVRRSSLKVLVLYALRCCQSLPEFCMSSVMRVNLENISVKFHPDPIWSDESLMIVPARRTRCAAI